MFYGGALLAEGVALPASLLRLIILQGGVLVLIAIPISRAAKAFGIWHETPADARWRVNNLPLHHWIRWWVWRPRRIIS
ncbi:MAG: hypothetical protein COU85_01010 [Candidatus Portnoybacteria bacterium CG10_big_fil_rev_8_21_14_0_10_44_7]|uniref:Uncharacterized protein n=1 Tax=Candidatus Portnoybacteria bacterium CG10_big_fil_rev_8_21_14_0_10_44_7 TaxID=1974816 RepID=A0A2M8KJ50_9BACT|nr:MAG: hypothetical protein COU85_01010 [Candidatus Portnoybacteria bacterium CG10_big_fil_rev_8_21_14_0_10_44_7]